MPEKSKWENATFHSFKESGKWYATGRGYLSSEVFKVFDRDQRRDQIIKDNDGKYPGLSSTGSEFVFVVIGDENVEHGYPLMLKPVNNGD